MGLEVQPAPGSKTGMEGEVRKFPPAPKSEIGIEGEVRDLSPPLSNYLALKLVYEKPKLEFHC